jgi:hypothetical protein
LQKGKKNAATFALKNSGNQPLIISNINASCGCIKPIWNRNPIAPGKETSVTLEIEPEDAGFFHKTVQIHCNTEKDDIMALVIIHDGSKISFSFGTEKAIITVGIVGKVKE